MLFRFLASSLSPNRCYRIDLHGAVLPTRFFWMTLLVGAAGLVLVLLNLITGILAASVLLIVIVSGLNLLNAGVSACEQSKKKCFKNLGFNKKLSDV
ncbi:MAG: hypothetical protein R3B45_02640 [Bdellovibrionota bacterium]